MANLLLQDITLKSAKRTKTERNGLHAWHPYYAGYSEAFVQSAIEYLGLSETDIILDPWNGSGTTGVMSTISGVKSIGVDVNDVMNIFAAAKSPMVLNHKGIIYTALKTLKRKISKSSNASIEDDALLEFMSPSLCRLARQAYTCLSKYKYPCIASDEDLNKVLISFNKLNPVESFMKAALFMTLRELAGYKGGSNPTWLRGSTKKPSVRASTFEKTYIKHLELMLAVLGEKFSTESEIQKNLVAPGDSCNLPLMKNGVDAIITSPPYLTRIDYAVSTKPELLLINGDSDRFRQTRENTIGAPVILKSPFVKQDAWGKTCNRLLQGVEKHSSKAAKSYYWKNMIQYFDGIGTSLAEAKRVLRKGGRALIVVQSSYFKDLKIDLPKIYYEMIDMLGCESKIAREEIVKGHMAHVNTKSNGYVKNKVFKESVVEMRKV